MKAQAEHKQAQAQGEPKQARANFGIFQFWCFQARYHRFCEEFNNGNDSFPKLDFCRLSVNPSIPEIPNSRFADFGYFEPDITDFVKNLIREVTASQNWILAV